MGFFKNLFGNKAMTTVKLELVTERGNGFYSWNGRLYQSDIIRSCIRPKSKAIGKLVAKHIRGEKEKLKINPEPYIRFLLEEPNPFMTGQMLQEKLAVQLDLNNNAFALIVRDEFGYPQQLYPIPCIDVEAIYTKSKELHLKFRLKKGKLLKVPYRNILHLRQDFNENDIFGDSPGKVLTSLMEVVNTTDQGIIKAIKNSNIIKWLLKFKQTLQPKDREIQVKDFVKNYLSIESNTVGAAATDPRYDAEQVKPESYVPNAAQMDRTITRIYNYFNINEKIVQSKWSGDEWNAYYEAVIEPLARQMSGELTRKLFTRKERSFGNKIIFEASNLQHASMDKKLGFVAMVDRGAMTPNEWRKILNLGPIEGGDKPIRRLDTAIVKEGGEKNEDPD